MHKSSVTFPAFDWQRDGAPMDDIRCKGLTARMHQKFMGGDDGRSQSRRKESSLMPPITPRKLSASSQSSSSSSKDHDGAVKQKNREKVEKIKTSNFDVQDEIGYLKTKNSSNESTSEKLSNRGHKFYTLHETKKLPEILKPMKEKSPNISIRKRKGHAKQGKQKADGKCTWNGLPGETQIPSINTGEAEFETRDEFNDWKYGVDWKHRLGWDITRPFTYSYFPKIQEKRKKKEAETADSRAKKSQPGKGATMPHLRK